MFSVKNKKFMVIDGNALIHRSWHALPPLTTKAGEMVNAVYGFTAVLLKALREFKPDYVALTLDRKEKTFRHDEYDKYKATRVKAPAELYQQIPKVKEVAQAFGIPIYELAGYEADDLIGTLAHSVDGTVEKIIVTGDLDTLQLINDQTKVFTMKRGLTDSVLYDAKIVKQRYGLEPEQMIDFKALRGDPSDNIPGVKGIGEKTAIELLQEFKTLDGVYKYVNQFKSSPLYGGATAAAGQAKIHRSSHRSSGAGGTGKSKEKIKERILELLKQYKNDAYLSRKLATIKCDVPIKFNLTDANFGSFNREQTAELFSRLEFNSLLPRLQNLMAHATTPASQTAENKFERDKIKFKYYLVDQEKDFVKFFNKLKKQKEFVFDTETASFDSVTAELLGISFSWKAGEAYYINFQFPISNSQFPNKSQIPNPKKVNLFNYQGNNSRVNEWLEMLKPIFEDKKIKKYGHNIKYDIEVMASLGIKVRGLAGDSMIASYLLNPGSRQHNLDAVTFAEFNFQKITKEDLLGKGREKIEFREVPLAKLYLYSCEDADFTFRLIKKLLPKLKAEKLFKLFLEIEMPLVKVLAQMEMYGIKINSKFLANIKIRTDKRIKQLANKVYQAAGKKFNINSTQQLREILYDKLEISTLGITKTKTGLSTGADELMKLKGQHPIIALIQEYRELAKLSSTYIDALPELVNSQTGRLHTSFNQSVTATGRLSSTEPNLQNIPVRTELGREIRQSFIAAVGFQLLSLDYSQIELRLAAHMSGDKKMIKAFASGADIHRATAAEINQVKLENVTAEMRQQAKATNFGILYGQGPHGLSQNADIPYARAKEFIDQYFKIYQGVKKFIDQTIKSAKERGYAETLFGRRRYLPEINSSVLQVRKAAERMAINTPLQGTAADIIKIAMIKISRILNELNSNEHESNNAQMAPIRMLLQVHDELLFEVRTDLVKEVAKKIKRIMEEVIKLKVPIIVDAKSGDNWGEMETITNYELRITNYE